MVKGSDSHVLNQLSAKERGRLTNTQTYEAWDYPLILSCQLPANERLQQLFDQGLRELKDSGRYAQLW